MSLHFLLDGYNIVHQMPSLINHSLEEQRNGLIRFLESNRPQGSLRNKLTVIFDGKAGVYGGRPDSYIHVIFSSDESADDKIRRLVSTQSNKKNIIVVTDDRDIQYSVRAVGAKVEGVSVFLQRVSIKKKSGKSSGQKDDSLSKTAEQQINDELKNVWLKPKNTENT